jgi:opacity protein-like surface antigen
MDSKFVHIDKLFKDGLSGGEEPEQSGAWLRMQELLDKEMPRGAAPIARRRFKNRYWMPALLLLLTGGAGGALYFYDSQNIAGNASKQLTDTPVSARHLATAPPNGNNAFTSAVSDNKDNADAGLPKTAHAPQEGDVNVSNVLAQSSTPNTRPLAQLTAERNHPNISSHTQSGDLVGAKANQSASTSSEKTITDTRVAGRSGALTAQGKVAVPNEALLQASLAENEVEKAVQANISKLAASSPAVPYSKQEISATQRELMALADNGSLVVLDDNRLAKKSEQEITKLNITERPVYDKDAGRVGRPVKFVPDTTSIAKTKQVIYQDLNPLEVAAISKMVVKVDLTDLLPMSASVRNAFGERGVKLMSLEQFKVKSKKTTPEKINEVISNTTSGVASLFDGTRPWHAALMLGGNGAFAKPTNYGMHIGIGGFYSLSERLTLGAELKYFSRRISNYSIDDNATKYTAGSPTVSGSDFIFNYVAEHSTRTYTVQNTVSLELPIYLSYNLGRLSIFGGANIAYAFALNPVVSTNISSTNSTITTNTMKFPYENTSAQILASDFKSRLGLGYVIGANYDLNRNLSLDMRLTHNVWDNASTEMSRKISTATFKQPSLQIGLNFFFGRREKVMYILER